MRVWRDVGEAMTEAMNSTRVLYWISRPGHVPDITPREAIPADTQDSFLLFIRAHGGKRQPVTR